VPRAGDSEVSGFVGRRHDNLKPFPREFLKDGDEAPEAIWIGCRHRIVYDEELAAATLRDDFGEREPRGEEDLLFLTGRERRIDRKKRIRDDPALPGRR
jgi:hypothetical protein